MTLKARPIAQAIVDAAEQWTEGLAGRRKDMLPLPWPTLQHKYGGLPKGKLIVVGGRSSEHKTTAALEMAEHVAKETPEKVLVWTAEDDDTDLAARRIASETMLITTRDLMTGSFRGGKPNKINAQDLKEAHQRIAKMIGESWAKERLWVSHDDNLSLEHIKKTIKEAALQGFAMVVFDYVHLADPGGDWSATHARKIFRTLAMLAKSLHIVVLVTGQCDKVGTQASGDQQRVPKDTEMLHGSSLRQVAHGVFMVGKAKDGFQMVVTKWKWGDAPIIMPMSVNPAHDRLVERVR